MHELSSCCSSYFVVLWNYHIFSKILVLVVDVHWWSLPIYCINGWSHWTYRIWRDTLREHMHCNTLHTCVSSSVEKQVTNNALTYNMIAKVILLAINLCQPNNEKVECRLTIVITCVSRVYLKRMTIYDIKSAKLAYNWIRSRWYLLSTKST